jgi:hypothetical protein
MERSDKLQFIQLLAVNGRRVKANTWKNKDGTPNIKNHKIYAEYLGEILGYKEKEDWYQITIQQIKRNYGGGLLYHYNDSPIKLVKAVFTDYEWLDWKFTNTPRGFWSDKQKQKSYMNWLGNELEYRKEEDWYQITKEQIASNYGGGLLFNYNHSPIKLVKAVFTDYEWLDWKFSSTPQGFWNDKKNHKGFMNWLGNELEYRKEEDWYKITYQKIVDNYGSTLLHHYNHSPIKLVKAVFPDYKWLDWKFTSTPQGFWNDKKNHKGFMNWLENELGYTKMEDWYQITIQQIAKNYGNGLLDRYNGNLTKLIMETYPEYSWDKSKFKKNYSQQQIEFLNYMLVSIPDIRHVLNNDDGEFYIPGSKELIGKGLGYHADGYSEKENTVFEFLGDFWHGNPTKYNPKDINPVTKTTYGSLYDKEKEREQFCIQKGYKYYSIWESDWVKGKWAVIKLQTIFKNKRKF